MLENLWKSQSKNTTPVLSILRSLSLCPNLFSEQVWQHWLAFRKRTRLRLRSRTAVATATHFHDCAAAAARHATCRDFQIRCASEFVLTVVEQPNCDSDSDGNDDVSRVRVCLLSQLLGLALSLSCSLLSIACGRLYLCACVLAAVCVGMRYQRAGPGPALLLACRSELKLARSLALFSLSPSVVLLLSCLIAKLYEYVL